MSKRKLLLIGLAMVAALNCGAVIATNNAVGRGDYLGDEHSAYPQPIAGVNLLLGNPSNSKGSNNDPNNFLIIKSQFTLSYSKQKGGPNWVSWHVERGDLGRGRVGNFAPDASLPQDWRIGPLDYAQSGYDRGQMCPAADRNSSPVDNRATLVMSNILPQRADINRGIWRKLEEYSRSLVRQQGMELYVIAGGYGWEGTIADGKVQVPKQFWKVIVAIPDGDDDLNRIDSKTRVIAVDMPNRQGIGGNPWTKYITSVRAIENQTGYHFLTSLPTSVQLALKVKRDRGRTMAVSQ